MRFDGSGLRLEDVNAVALILCQRLVSWVGSCFTYLELKLQLRNIRTEQPRQR